jgi:tartrate-resistant acid phosphatase type 5
MKKMALGRWLAGAIGLVLLSACQTYTHLAAKLEPVDVSSAVKDLSAADEVLFLIIGDTGRGNQTQKDVGDAMDKVCVQRRPVGCDFALVAGDLIYGKGVHDKDDPQFVSKFEEPFAALEGLPMWSVPGNHDWQQENSVQGQIDRSRHTGRDIPRWLMPFNHYSVPGLPAWLTVYGLDTTIIHDLHGAQGADLDSLTLASRLEVEAAKTALCGRAGWRLLFGHHPVYSSGPHGQEMDGANASQKGFKGLAPVIHRELIAPLITACKVQVYLAGHDHHQEWLHSTKENFYQVIQGAVAEVRAANGPFSVPDVVSHREECRGPGFGLATATRTALKVDFYLVEKDAAGTANVRLCDSFSLAQSAQ